MRILFKDTERDHGAVFNSTAENGRSITDSYSFSPRIKSKHVTWVRPLVESHANIPPDSEIPEDIRTVIWTDRAPLFYFGFNTTVWTLHEYEIDSNLYNLKKPIFKGRRNIHMLLEPPDGCGESYNFHRKFQDFTDVFDLVLTHNKELSENHAKCKWYPWGTTPLDSEDDFKIYSKNKLVSFYYSNKQWWTGHRHRHEIGEKLKKDDKFKFVDVVGPLFVKYYTPKLETVKDYYFSVQVENQKVDDFFTDKIIDCFLTGTIPIYCGTNNIIKYFNKDGIIQFDTYEELTEILYNLSDSFYTKNYHAVLDNFNRAKEYISPDDWIYKTYGSEVFI